MTATLQQRVASAKTNTRLRTSDLHQLRADLVAEKTRLLALHQVRSAASVNFSIAERDRDEAAADADRISRTLHGLESEIAAIDLIVTNRLSTEKATKVRETREAALAERDALAAEIPKLYAEAAGKLIGLAQRIIASDENLRACGLGTEISAEAIARGCTGLFSLRGMPIIRLTQIRLPEFDGINDLWPRPEPSLAGAFTGALANLEKRHTESLAAWQAGV